MTDKKNEDKNRQEKKKYYTELQDWKKQSMAGMIFEAGNSVYYETGSWRSMKPIWDAEKCINCLRCFYYCPDSAITVDKDGKVNGVDYRYCKGCGICARECPDKVKAINMIVEGSDE